MHGTNNLRIKIANCLQVVLASEDLEGIHQDLNIVTFSLLDYLQDFGRIACRHPRQRLIDNRHAIFSCDIGQSLQTFGRLLANRRPIQAAKPVS